MYNIVITLPIFLLPTFLISTKLYMCIWLNTKKKKNRERKEEYSPLDWKQIPDSRGEAKAPENI